MKILFTGGGSGGHFYPIIAVAEAVREVAKEKKVLDPELYYMAPTKYNPRALFDNEITFVSVPAGKLRRYFSLLNITDIFKTAAGICSATLSMFRIYPDVVFGKGGYASFPALVAARCLRIPVVIHESDSKPGKVNAWAGKFARDIAVSYPEAGEYFTKMLGKKAMTKVVKSDTKKETVNEKDASSDAKNDKKTLEKTTKIAYTGNPIRKEILFARSTGARDFFKLEERTPVIMVIGGSQGSKIINDVMVDAVPELIKKYVVIHQTGRRNFTEISTIMSSVLKGNPNVYRYKPMAYFDDITMRMAAGVADVVISRAGSSIFEIAAWGKASIIVPLNETVSHDQTENAFSYARSGACSVIEEKNLTPHIIVSEIDRITGNPGLKEKMEKSAQSFARTDAATEIAEVLIEIGLEHE